jgi:hypothetical protein
MQLAALLFGFGSGSLSGGAIGGALQVESS